jgi:hypothetical protein
VFLEFWRQGLLAYDAKHGIEWEWFDTNVARGQAGNSVSHFQQSATGPHFPDGRARVRQTR